MSERVYILGGHQSDFAQNAMRRQQTLFDLMREAALGGMAATGIDPEEIDTAHVANFCGELFCGQGLLGGYFSSIHPAFDGLPTSRHEAACASGSVAALAATAEISAGRYNLACVLGVEMMRNVSPEEAARNLGTAAWAGREFQDARFIWPRAFSELADEYDARYGLRDEHLARIAQVNFENARANPNAQTRSWAFTPESFTADDTANPPVEGRLRRQDCGQITDGAAVVFLASESFARDWAARRGRTLADVPFIKGWGHRTSQMLLADKVKASRSGPYVFPHVRGTITDAFARAGIADAFALDGIETHDCFTVSEYMAIDHFGITAPGESWRAVEDGWIEKDGRIPVNPSGGLIGCGHPVGATGVRMMLDAHNQVTGQAGDMQIAGARNFATLNIGGAATTSVSFVIGRAD